MDFTLEAALAPVPLPNDYCRLVWLASVVALSALYYAATHLSGFAGLTRFEKAWPEEKREKRALLKTKQRSWILTGTAALVMTLGSVPFVLDLLLSGFDVAAIARRSELSQALACFFMAYLGVDLVLGSIHYPSQVSLLTGWVHHTAYQILLYFVLHAGSAHVFCMAAVMELPTFVLASAFIWPALRSDELFIALFFVTRIAFHAALGVLYATPYGITRGTTAGGEPITSCLPIIGLALAAPLHAMWFSSSVRGYLKRRKHAPPSPPSPLLKPLRAVRPQLLRMASSISSLPPSAFTLSSSMPSLQLNAPAWPTALSSRARANVGSLRGPQRSRLRARLEEEMAAFFASNGAEWRKRDQDDVLKALSPLGQVRMRAGRRGDEVRRLWRSKWTQAPLASY